MVSLHRRAGAVASDLAAANEALAKAATTDTLTALVDRRRLDAELGRLTSLARRHVRPRPIVFVDVDLFEPINDTLGHDVGDRLLVAISGALTVACRRADVAGRDRSVTERVGDAGARRARVRDRTPTAP